MLEVSFLRDDRGRLAAVRAFGHADFAVAGEDVVCAGVSAILQAARLGLEEHAKIPLEATQQSGELEMAWPAGVRDDPAVVAIVETAELAVRQIAEQFPQHVRIVPARRGGATTRPNPGK
jgi:uncharacterized protein YsxB (DUF464 family)